MTTATLLLNLSALLLFSSVRGAATAAASIDSNHPDVPQVRHEHAICFLKNVLFVIGGRGSKDIYAYRDDTGEWINYGKPPNSIGDGGKLHHFQCFEWKDGIVIGASFTGGFPREGTDGNIYYFRPREPEASRWSVLGTLPANRLRGSTGGFKRQGKIFQVGGNDGGHGQGDDDSKTWFDMLNPKTGAWTVLPDINLRRDHTGAVYSNYDDAAYFLAGRNGGKSDFFALENARLEIERYSFANGISGGTWEIVASTKYPHPGMTPTRVSRMIIIGDGEVDGRTDQASHATEIWHVKRNKFLLVDQLPKFDSRHGTGYAGCNNAVWTATGARREGNGNQEFGGVQAMHLDGTVRQCTPKNFWN
eukprot:CAMPEP_0198366244 /NCGR_PEP_ID=MMETSP1450-20131203/154582_1 /TAXON_ID=753684 ORGANISM="Madagascaria erythrocladiodes, Strain CCMP3234" /NCGR_SAMPLE_ID=MMETSP1450 /ASSEMBLY_ACC=CAM_ASM_001115 /LENGTH=361 /DNA_ID=CAMNT_0044073709 /DNA_START=74 /DNA_END=1159 /DNA_ORIENTATION=+